MATRQGLTLLMVLPLLRFAAGVPIVVRTEADLLTAVAVSARHIVLAANISLSSTLVISSAAPLLLEGPGVLSVAHGSGPVLQLQHAHGVQLRNLGIALESAASHAAALEVRDSRDVTVSGCAISGGVLLAGTHGALLQHSDISNAAGANNGSCVAVVSCGNASTLQPCNVTVADNFIHDCRAPAGGSPYAAQAQGVLLGGAEGSAQCTVGVVVTHNDVRRVDEMGIRVNNDNYGACVLNQVTLNRVTDWGQLPKAAGGDTTDSGCLYQYGHIFSPGNNWSFNACVSTNASWGQNGAYLDDAATGNNVVGNVFVNATAGSPLKINGGAQNTVDSNLVIGGIDLGFANCRGLRGAPQLRYTCANYPNWLAVIQENDLAGHWPWYDTWCTNTTAGPNATLCAPAGAPPGYACESLSRGNSVRNLAGVWMARNVSFALDTAPGLPVGGVYSHCPDFVLSGAFNDIDWGSVGAFFGTDQFVDAAGGDYTLRDDSDVYARLPGFARIPWRDIGPRAAPLAA